MSNLAKLVGEEVSQGQRDAITARMRRLDLALCDVAPALEVEIVRMREQLNMHSLGIADYPRTQCDMNPTRKAIPRLLYAVDRATL